MAAVTAALNRPVQRREIKLTSREALDQEVARQLGRLPAVASDAERTAFLKAGLDDDDAASSDSDSDFTIVESEEDVTYASGEDAAGKHVPRRTGKMSVRKLVKLPKYVPKKQALTGVKDPADEIADSYVPNEAERRQNIYKALPDADKKMYKSVHEEYNRIYRLDKEAAGGRKPSKSDAAVQARALRAYENVKAARAAKISGVAYRTAQKAAYQRGRLALKEARARAAGHPAGPRSGGSRSGPAPGGAAAHVGGVDA